MTITNPTSMEDGHSQFAAAIAQICDEKNIDKDTVIGAIQAAMAAAYRKDFGTQNQKVRVDFDILTGLSKVYRQWDVVETVENEEAELVVADAKAKKKSPKIGDVVEEDVTPSGYGRIAAQTAKQVIIQRIREAEREAIYNTYKDRETALVNAQVQRVEGSGAAFLDLEKATVVMERQQQIPGESFYTGQRIRIYIERVERTEKGPQIVISRTHSGMIRRLLELEVPEIADGSVEIKNIAREAGTRTKVAVASTAEGVDPVGACVGQKGVRIQAVTDELAGERIDIVPWSDDSVQYLINALRPAKIISVQLEEARKLAKVYVTEDQRSVAIGKEGQNVRLASILTGWEIDIENFMSDEDKAAAEAAKNAPVEAPAEAEVVADVSTEAQAPAETVVAEEVSAVAEDAPVAEAPEVAVEPAAEEAPATDEAPVADEKPTAEEEAK